MSEMGAIQIRLDEQEADNATLRVRLEAAEKVVHWAKVGRGANDLEWIEPLSDAIDAYDALSQTPRPQGGR